MYQTTGLFEIPELVPVLVGSVWELELRAGHGTEAGGSTGN